MKLLALVDCDNFYASCERVFRPDLKQKPIVVLSNNDGCVIARSKEAKAMGIKAASLYNHIKNKDYYQMNKKDTMNYTSTNSMMRNHSINFSNSQIDKSET